jgi:hypothetical protein
LVISSLSKVLSLFQIISLLSYNITIRKKIINFYSTVYVKLIGAFQIYQII